MQGLVALAQDLVKPEFTAKKYVPEAPTEKMKNAQARTILLQAGQACCSCISEPASIRNCDDGDASHLPLPYMWRLRAPLCQCAGAS